MCGQISQTMSNAPVGKLSWRRGEKILVGGGGREWEY